MCRHARIALLSLLMSCMDGDTGPTPPPPQVGPVAIATVTVEPINPRVVEGSTIQLTATPRDAQGNALEGRVIHWNSNRTAIATVSGTGLVTGILVGSSKISAESEGKTGETLVIVALVPVASVTVSPPLTLEVGASGQLSATLKDAQGNVLSEDVRIVTWSSANNAVASVNQAGLVTATGLGETSISATSEGQSGEVQVTAVAPKSPQLSAGERAVRVRKMP